MLRRTSNRIVPIKTLFTSSRILLLALVLVCFSSFISVVWVHTNAFEKSSVRLARSDDGAAAANAEAKFHNSWPKLKEVLCPEMKPNIHFGSQIFDLARNELRMRPLDDAKASSRMAEAVETSHAKAFTWSPGGWAFDPGEGGESIPAANITLYLSIFKCGNNQIKEFAMERLKGRGRFTKNVNLQPIFDKISRISTEGDSLKNICVVTAIRDPIERFLSGYNEIEWRAQMEPGRLNSSNPLLFARYQGGTKARFEQFVADYVTGPDRSGWNWYPMEFGHVWSMSGVLSRLDREGGKMTAYLPSLDNLAHKWPAFLVDTCPGIPSDIAETPMALAGQHESSSDPFGYYAAAKGVWDDRGNTARAICALNVMDYACWDRLAVPLLCREVFSSDSFAKAITSRSMI